MRKIWLMKPPHPKLQRTISDALGVHPIVAQLLINRQIKNVKEAEDFLKADLSRLHDPYLLKDMPEAIKRIKKAKEKKEKVLIFGDYDVDGVTSSVLLRHALLTFGLEVIHYIPHRINEGYGLNHNIIQHAKDRDVKLLISVDCGIGAFEEIDALKKQGIDTIVVDHHEPHGNKLPRACAVIDPKREDCPYPFKDLASVGLVLKLSQALLGVLDESHLDLVALGTIADVADLWGENRVFAKEGLKRLENTENKGLIALKDVARLKKSKMQPYMVSFILGPRLNATGRISTAEKSLKLLLSETDEEARELAKSLEEDNQKRQKMQSEIVDEALSLVERDINFKEHKVIVLSKEGWHKGVLGIVASRIMDIFYRPAIVISIQDGVGTGSGRSIGNFHLVDALHHCSEFLENYGGHKMAAGLTIRDENISLFSKTINDFAGTVIGSDDLIPTLELDCEVPLESLNLDLCRVIETIEPFGVGNPTPLFCSRGLIMKGRPSVFGRDTLKFWVSNGQTTLPAIGFGMAKYRDLIENVKRMDLAFNLTVDDWNKDPTVLLQVKDIKESQTS